MALFPEHLPRIEMVADIEDHACPCCHHVLHRIGDDVSERLDIIPAQLRVLVVRRPKYACRACEEVVARAAAPARLIAGGLPTDATVAQVLVSKYADHLPLYRQAQIYARQDVTLDRSTLADWVGRVACLLRPVYDRALVALKMSATLLADETMAPGARSQARAYQDPEAAPIRRASPMSTRPTGRSRISAGSRGFCRSTVMAAAMSRHQRDPRANHAGVA